MRPITHENRTQHLAAWSRELGISETAILYRLETGQPIRRALRGRRGPGDRIRTGRDPAATIRFPPKILAAIDESAARQTDKPGRSEAIRRLVETLSPPKKRERNNGPARPTPTPDHFQRQDATIESLGGGIGTNAGGSDAKA